MDGARLVVFGICAGFCALGLVLPFLPRGPMLFGVLGLMAAGSLGVFPLYHAFTQDLPGSRQGMVTGMAGVAGWMTPAMAHEGLGRLKMMTGSYDAGLAVAGLLPCVALGLLAWAWRAGARPAAS